MMIRKTAIIVMAIIPSILLAREAGVPTVLQQEILSQHPELDTDGDRDFSHEEHTKG